MSRFIYGLRPVEELLRAKQDVALVYFVEGDRSPMLVALSALCRAYNVTAATKPRGFLDDLSGGRPHQGVVAVSGEFVYCQPEDLITVAGERGEAPLLVALDSVQDPQNLGALVRSAHVLGAHGVLIPRDRAAQVTGSVVKASAGATEYTPIAQCTNLVRTLDELKQAGLWIVGAVADGGEEPSRIDLTAPSVLVLGSEGRGIRQLVQRTCDLLVCIPMAGTVASLNVSAAGAILLYEASRQRKAAKAS